MKHKRTDSVSICFDLDHTLLNTLQIRKDIFTLVRVYGVSNSRLKKAYGGAVGERFTPRKFVTLLGLEQEKQNEILKKIWMLVQAGCHTYIYPGVPKLLARLKKLFPLYLVTHGDSAYQRIKLQQSGLAHYFTRVLVTPEIAKKTLLKKLFRETGGFILLIDDSRRVQKSARDIGFPIIKVRKSYKDRAYSEELYHSILKRCSILHKKCVDP